MEIDGYAFCLGLKSVNLLYDNAPGHAHDHEQPRSRAR